MALVVEEIDITSFIGDGRVTLEYTPSDPAEVAVDPVGGPAQVLGEDFIVVGNELIWDDPSIADSDIKGVLNDGYDVVLRVQYDR